VPQEIRFAGDLYEFSAVQAEKHRCPINAREQILFETAVHAPLQVMLSKDFFQPFSPIKGCLGLANNFSFRILALFIMFEQNMQDRIRSISTRRQGLFGISQHSFILLPLATRSWAPSQS
jgi:hypothetical protein